MNKAPGIVLYGLSTKWLTLTRKAFPKYAKAVPWHHASLKKFTCQSQCEIPMQLFGRTWRLIFHYWFAETGWWTLRSDPLGLLWASYQIRKIAGCACAGNAGNVSFRRRFQRKPLFSDPGMHHGTCVTHVPWCMSGSLTCGDGENVPGIPGACAPAILCIWQEAHVCASFFETSSPWNGTPAPTPKLIINVKNMIGMAQPE